MKETLIELWQGDCFDVLEYLFQEEKRIDAVIADPPFGMTFLEWDKQLEFKAIWARLWAIFRSAKTPTVLFGIEPFSSTLRMSNISEYRYDWKWDKVKSSNPFNAKIQPLRVVEDIIVFYQKSGQYYPQMVERPEGTRTIKEKGRTLSRGDKTQPHKKSYGIDATYTHRYPTNYLRFSAARNQNSLHPTQKPLKLMEYLVKTYTQPGQTVLDFCGGVATTALACYNTGRSCISIELNPKYVDASIERLTVAGCGFTIRG